MTDAERHDHQVDEDLIRPGDEAAPAPDGQQQAEAEPVAETEPVVEGDQGASAVERDPEQLLEALEEAERTAAEYLDHLRRERAEFENFRKRMHRERMEALDRGAEQLVANLLGVLDNFGYTVQAAEGSEDDRLAKGVAMVHAELTDVLTQAGLQEVPGVGAPFDPTVHEAMIQEDADEDLDEPVVSEVLRAGYQFKGRVLRPASVKVRK